MTYFIIQCISALFACFGFSLIFQLRGKDVPIAVLCGVFSWAVYLIADSLSDSAVLPYFFAGAAAAFYSETAAVIFCSPVTVYLIPGIIPTVPGLTIYRAMEAGLMGNIEGFLEKSVETFKIGGAITMGLILFSACFRLCRGAAGKDKA